MPVSSRLIAETVTVTTVGGAGVATGNAASGALYGGLYAVYLNYHASAPATTVVTLSDAYGTIVAFVASATDKRWYPRMQTCDAAGAAIAGVYEIPALIGPVTVTVTASDALTGAVAVTLVVSQN
jgi:hypothetical protein